jgi:uncharacterized protein YcbK (DUF882 family)
MTRLIAALLATSLLAGCFPMAMFASSGSAYNPYRQNWGTYVASKSVDTFCLTPSLRFAIWDFEGHFGKKIVANSAYRSPEHNRAVGGAERSMHMRCMAADFFMPGVPKQKLIAYAMRNRLIGGLGCYPGSNFIHIDVRERPRGWKRPVTFGGGC